jgi:hypothetical protein
VFFEKKDEFELLGILNSCCKFLQFIAPTLHYGIGEIKKIPSRLKQMDIVKKRSNSKMIGILRNLMGFQGTN